MLISAIALAGGGGRATTGSCGAYSGGLMALSTGLCPRSEEFSDADSEQLERARPTFYEFRDWFIEEFSGVRCADVLHKLFGGYYNLNNENDRDELRKAQAKAGFTCQVVISKVVMKVADMLSRDA